MCITKYKNHMQYTYIIMNISHQSSQLLYLLPVLILSGDVHFLPKAHSCINTIHINFKSATILNRSRAYTVALEFLTDTQYMSV